MAYDEHLANRVREKFVELPNVEEKEKNIVEPNRQLIELLDKKISVLMPYVCEIY